jgi:hypothetical protein
MFEQSLRKSSALFMYNMKKKCTNGRSPVLI